MEFFNLLKEMNSAYNEISGLVQTFILVWGFFISRRMIKKATALNPESGLVEETLYTQAEQAERQEEKSVLSNTCFVRAASPAEKKVHGTNWVMTKKGGRDLPPYKLPESK